MSSRRRKPESSTNPLERALRAVAASLDASERPGMIIGGIAAIARGVPRLTRDIDATVVGEGTDLRTLLVVLAKHGIEPRIRDAVAFAERSHVLLLEHKPTGIPVDLSVAWLPFELEAIAASETATIHGARVRIARAEDLVIYKIAAWRPQDQQDVERLVALHHGNMDFGRIRAFAHELSTLLEDASRAAEVEAVLRRATLEG